MKMMNEKTKRNIIATIFLAAGVGTLPGCFPIIATGVVQGVLVLGDRRPVSVSTIDRGLQLQIESSVTKNFGEVVHVNVHVFNQKVLITGEASNPAIKEQIGAIAKAQSNAKTVFNELQVGVISSAGSRVSDSTLFTIIKTKFLATTDIPSNSMKIVVEAGRVYLLGLVTELEAKAAATVASSSSSSVKEVIKFFDIISEEEKARLDNPGKPEPTST
jgi:osmotically-inducible protein OsmY